MRERVFGYWTLTWLGLISNIIAIPIISYVIIFLPPLRVANITLASSLGLPAAMARCDSWNCLISSSFSREKMGSNLNFSIFIYGNFWHGSLFSDKAYNPSRHLWNWWIYSFNNIIKYLSSTLLV